MGFSLTDWCIETYGGSCWLLPFLFKKNQIKWKSKNFDWDRKTKSANVLGRIPDVFWDDSRRYIYVYIIRTNMYTTVNKLTYISAYSHFYTYGSCVGRPRARSLRSVAGALGHDFSNILRQLKLRTEADSLRNSWCQKGRFQIQNKSTWQTWSWNFHAIQTSPITNNWEILREQQIR